MLKKKKLLGENQWGTHPRRIADTTALIDELINEIHRISYRSLTTLQNDAATCFDRMIRNLSSVCSRLHYVPDSVCRLQANALRRMKYKIRTIHGTSSKTYSNSVAIPIHRQGQGTGFAGTTWAFHSIPMIRVIEKSCSGCVMSSPNQLYQLTKYVLGFVDDKRQYSNDWKENNLAKIVTQLKHAAQSWEHLLYTTGGKLEISKCGIYIME